MPRYKTSRVTVELETGADPIRGSIERPDGRSQPFWGWLELIETLQRAAAVQPGLDAERGKSETPPGKEQS